MRIITYAYTNYSIFNISLKQTLFTNTFSSKYFFYVEPLSKSIGKKVTGTSHMCMYVH